MNSPTSLTALLLLGLAGPAQGALTIEALELCTAQFGAPVGSVQAGETAVVRLKIRGAGLNEMGDLQLETGLKMWDADGVLLGEDPRAATVTAPNMFQAEKIPAFFSIPPQSFPKAGSYRVQVTVRDLSQEPPAVAEGRLRVVVREGGFYAGNARITLDPQGAFETAGPFRVGQTICLCQNLIGFTRKGGEVELTADLEVRSRDDEVLGLKERLRRLVGPVPEAERFLRLAAFVNLTQAGQFELRLKITDHLQGASRVALYRITVLADPKRK